VTKHVCPVLGQICVLAHIGLLSSISCLYRAIISHPMIIVVTQDLLPGVWPLDLEQVIFRLGCEGRLLSYYRRVLV